MRAITYAVKYLGPTATLGSRYKVTNLGTKESRTVPYNYQDFSALRAVEQAYWDHTVGTLVYSGGDSDIAYITSIIA